MDARLKSVSPNSLEQLMNLDISADLRWEQADLTAMLRHQLDAPLGRGVASLIEADTARIAVLRTSVVPPIASLRGLLEHPTPPEPLLTIVKDFAKQCREHPDRGLPGAIATAIYFAVIARAWVCYGTTISSLDQGLLLDGLRWLDAQDWADATVRQIAKSAILALQAKPG